MSLSIAMNHCGVLRKITGFFERHECGYWCLSRAARDQHAGFDQGLDHRLVGVAFLAFVVEHALAGKARCLIGKAAVGIDGVGDNGVDALRGEPRCIRRPDIKVFAAMARRGVDKARACVVGYVIPSEQWNGIPVSCVEFLKRVGTSHFS